MEKKNIIIAILIIIIIILAAAMAVKVMPSLTAKESKITIMGNKTFNEGDNLTVKLTDLNKTPIEKAVVNVAVLDKNGKAVLNKSVTTDSKGKASVNLDLDPGKYTVNVTFGGNSNYTGNNTSKMITIEEVVQQTTSSSSSSSSQSKTYASGLTDAEIDAYIQRDLDIRAKNGVKSRYDYQEARNFYENVPPTGMR